MIELINGIILFKIFFVFCIRLGYCTIKIIKNDTIDKPFQMW